MNINNAPSSSTAINMDDGGTNARPKASAAPPVMARLSAIFRRNKTTGGYKRGAAVLDLLLRLLTIGATLSAAIAMGTANETLPFFSRYFQFHADFYNFPQFTFFVVGNAVAAGYLLLSLPFSIVGICWPRSAASGPRILLLAFDVAMVALVSAAAANAVAIVYLAHVGNSSANWVAICIRLQDFCQQTSGAVIASFVGVVFFILIVVMSALALRKH